MPAIIAIICVLRSLAALVFHMQVIRLPILQAAYEAWQPTWQAANGTLNVSGCIKIMYYLAQKVLQRQPIESSV
jgi:hypothetical protein